MELEVRRRVHSRDANAQSLESLWVMPSLADQHYIASTPHSSLSSAANLSILTSVVSQ